MEQARPQRKGLRAMRVVLVSLGVLAIAALLVVFVRSMTKGKTTPSRPVAQVIQIVRPPPPPPDQPPPPPPPPEEKIQEVLPQNTPDPSPAPDAAPEQLGLDAEGSAGGDAFGLAARRGGADLVGTGSALFARNVGLIKQAVLDRLSDDDKVRRGSYTVEVRVWIAPDGTIEKVVLSKGTGRRELDAAIQQALSRPIRVGEAPPLEMPQPVNLRIVSRGQ